MGLSRRKVVQNEEKRYDDIMRLLARAGRQLGKVQHQVELCYKRPGPYRQMCWLPSYEQAHVVYDELIGMLMPLRRMMIRRGQSGPAMTTAPQSKTYRRLRRHQRKGRYKNFATGEVWDDD